MRFRSQFDEDLNKDTCSPSGSKEVPKYEKRLDKEGRKVLKQVGVQNIYNRIQAHDGEDLKSMIERLAPNEKKQLMKEMTMADVYKQTGEVYDLRDIPTSLVQSIQMAKDNQRKFEQLPIEIKREFNNSYTEFQALAQSNQKEFESKFAKHIKQPEPKPVVTGTTQVTPKEETL